MKHNFEWSACKCKNDWLSRIMFLIYITQIYVFDWLEKKIEIIIINKSKRERPTPPPHAY